MKKPRLWLLAVALGAALSLAAIARQQGTSHSTRLDGAEAALFNDISDNLICQCGCNLVLSQCGHIGCPSAIPMRDTIEEMILAKKSKAEIIAYFMKEYRFEGKPPVGKAILSQPETEGFDLIAWIMPFALFAVFLGVTIFVVLRFTKKQGTGEAAPALPEQEGYDQRIEDELRKTP